MAAGTRTRSSKADTGKDRTRFRPGFSGTVHTTDTEVVATIAGNVKRPAEVFVPMGGELPDNVLPSDLDKLEALGAFDPLPPRPTSGIVDAVTGAAYVLTNTAPEGRAVATPSDIRQLTDEEQAAQDALEAAKASVKAAFDETQTGTPATGSGGQPTGGVPSTPID